MSQMTLKSLKPDNKILEDGSEAENPLPSKVICNVSSVDILGLSWIFLDVPSKIGISVYHDNMRCNYS